VTRFVTRTQVNWCWRTLPQGFAAKLLTPEEARLHHIAHPFNLHVAASVCGWWRHPRRQGQHLTDDARQGSVAVSVTGMNGESSRRTTSGSANGKQRSWYPSEVDDSWRLSWPLHDDAYLPVACPST
jgi:hypothetical protein